LGKPWACWQGAELARGEWLLFTDADTTHHPDLLFKAVREAMKQEADALTLIGRQIMGSFWERILQPQFFMLLAGRFPGVGRVKKPQQWRQAIANGQYLLFNRKAYEGIGGHRAVAGDVVEDMRLAHLLVRGGWRLVVRGTEGLKTRMYRSLGGLVEGWSKNVATAALQSTVWWLRPVILPLSAFVAVVLWMSPPVVLAWVLLNGASELTLLWGFITTGLNVLIWSRASVLMGSSPLFGVLYPLGSVLGFYIFLKSWLQGPRIRWKDRRYRIPQDVRKGSSAAAEETGP
jgi:cellulose synthase/poly-beta-1,6-N-acetylglucosamine synthase-like glycosyltransferase